jgi:opacity protein-like surface antigen
MGNYRLSQEYFMKKFVIALFLGLGIGLSAHAAEAVNPIKVTCAVTQFNDLLAIEIQETDLKGQYQIVETIRDFAAKKNTNTYSAVFSMTEIEKSEFPLLTSWNGYTRTLSRSAPGEYSIETRDECSGFTTFLSCKESF